LFEETGLRTKDFLFVNLANTPRGKGHYIHAGFLAQGVKGGPVLAEPDRCYGWKWFPLNKLPKNVFSGHRAQIKAFKRKILFVED